MVMYEHLLTWKTKIWGCLNDSWIYYRALSPDRIESVWMNSGLFNYNSSNYIINFIADILSNCHIK